LQPFLSNGQEQFWKPEDIKRYNWLLSKAEDIIVCSEGSYSAYKMQVRNKYLVDNCDKLLACWDR
jgi:uncharacterized phage-like protein YoqJ